MRLNTINPAKIQKIMMIVMFSFVLFNFALSITGVFCDSTLSSVMANGSETIVTEFIDFYRAVFWPVFILLAIVFVLGPVKMKEVIKGILISLLVVYVVTFLQNPIEGTLEKIGEAVKG